MISIIAAVGKNNEIGKGNTLLWHMPADLEHFKKITSGHPVIMGRKTFESIGKPLPNRQNIVITRDKTYLRHGVNVVHSLEEALRRAQGKQEIFIIGGGELYKQIMPFADKLYITRVDAEDSVADAFFPEIIPIIWNEVSREEHKKDEKNPFDYTFSVYERI